MAIDAIDAGHAAQITTRQVKYLNSIERQDHRPSKRVARSMLGFKALPSAGTALADVEFMHIIPMAATPPMVPLACRSLIKLMRWLNQHGH